MELDSGNNHPNNYSANNNVNGDNFYGESERRVVRPTKRNRTGPYNREDKNKKKQRKEESFVGTVKKFFSDFFTYDVSSDEEGEPEISEVSSHSGIQSNEVEHSRSLQQHTPQSQIRVDQSKEDIIVKAIESRKEISYVEYEYYNKLLRDRLSPLDRDRLDQSIIAKIPRPIPLHVNKPPNEIIRTFLHKGATGAHTTSTTQFGPNTPASLRSTPIVSSNLKRGRISPPSSNSKEEATNGIDLSRSKSYSDNTNDTIYLDRQPPFKKRYNVAASETAKKIIDTLDQITSPLEDARKNPVIRERPKIPELQMQPTKQVVKRTPAPKIVPTPRVNAKLDEDAPPTTSITAPLPKKSQEIKKSAPATNLIQAQKSKRKKTTSSDEEYIPPVQEEQEEEIEDGVPEEEPLEDQEEQPLEKSTQRKITKKQEKSRETAGEYSKPKSKLQKKQIETFDLDDEPIVDQQTVDNLSKVPPWPISTTASVFDPTTFPAIGFATAAETKKISKPTENEKEAPAPASKPFDWKTADSTTSTVSFLSTFDKEKKEEPTPSFSTSSLSNTGFGFPSTITATPKKEEPEIADKEAKNTKSNDSTFEPAKISFGIPSTSSTASTGFNFNATTSSTQDKKEASSLTFGTVTTPTVTFPAFPSTPAVENKKETEKEVDSSEESKRKKPALGFTFTDEKKNNDQLTSPATSVKFEAFSVPSFSTGATFDIGTKKEDAKSSPVSTEVEKKSTEAPKIDTKPVEVPKTDKPAESTSFLFGANASSTTATADKPATSIFGGFGASTSSAPTFTFGKIEEPKKEAPKVEEAKKDESASAIVPFGASATKVDDKSVSTSIFGTSTSSSSNFTFGSTSSGFNFGQTAAPVASPFITQSTSTSLIESSGDASMDAEDKPATPANSFTFGANSTPAFPSTSNSSTSSTFGSTPTFGSQPFTFGSNLSTTPTFGSATTPTFSFGSTSLGGTAPTSTSSPFGFSAPAAPATGGFNFEASASTNDFNFNANTGSDFVFGGGPSSSSATTSVFGSSTPQQTSVSFGATPTFGSNTPPPVFGAFPPDASAPNGGGLFSVGTSDSGAKARKKLTGKRTAKK